MAKLLEGYGRRIQYSVFECEIEEASYARLYEKLLKQTLESGTDSICIYRLCKKCAGDVVTIGTARQGAASLKESAIIV